MSLYLYISRDIYIFPVHLEELLNSGIHECLLQHPGQHAVGALGQRELLQVNDGEGGRQDVVNARPWGDIRDDIGDISDSLSDDIDGKSDDIDDFSDSNTDVSVNFTITDVSVSTSPGG